MKNDFGMVGLGVMGQNFTLNLERNGYSVSVYERAWPRMRVTSAPTPAASSSDRKSTRLNSSHTMTSRMPSSA